ncbi:MAG: peptide ligase PGM1-related protein [Chloroflexota bacterium]|nr:peptide ligase PGM1-related protein [Chloroflexota bacterium]
MVAEMGSLPEAEERRRFEELQTRLAPLYERTFPDPRAAQTVVIVPSLSLDADELAKISGASYYEERLLCLLMLLRRPHTRVVYITSQPIAEPIIDYYLHLLPGIPISHARKRLELYNCHDGSSVPLSRKLLDRPRLLERIRRAIPDVNAAHITCFISSSLERSLAVQLGVPLYACDPELAWLGTKSGSREVFREAGIDAPAGFEHLRDERDVVHAVADLKRQVPDLRRAVLKLNEGFSGEGNAVFEYGAAPSDSELDGWLEAKLPERTRFEAPGETWDRYMEKLGRMGGVVEAFVEGGEIRSPSVQCRIDPLGGISVISTHDQVLGGPSGQVFLGCSFPASELYSREIQESALRAAEVLRSRGVLGRFGIDFISSRREGRWVHTAIEINLRKGGTTHPYLMLQFLTDGSYDPACGLYHTPTGQARYYLATDNLERPAYRGLSPDDLMDITADNGLHFDGATQQGVVFHLIGALSQHGKLGAVCIGDSRESARKLYDETIAILDRETGR